MTSHDKTTASGRSRDDTPPPETSDRADLQHRRVPIDGGATAFELSGTHFGQMHALREIAFTEVGLEAESDDGIPCGITITIGFQAEEQFARRGHVKTCDRHDATYHIAVAIDQSGPPAY
jgi:hypothetical protein